MVVLRIFIWYVIIIYTATLCVIIYNNVRQFIKRRKKEMDKTSSENKVCIYCDAEALPGTEPPVCSEHLGVKQASKEPTTLKDLENREG